jgi:hypothetical protein
MFQLEQAKWQVEERLKDKALDRQSREQLAQQSNQLRAEIAQMNIQGRQDTARLAASLRQPPAAPPVTPVTIADPDNPDKTVVIDGRTRQVLGAGPKLTQTGMADAKLAKAAPEARARVDSMVQNIDKLDAAIQELHDDPGLTRITGSLAGRSPNITNSATGAQTKLDSIKAQTFVSALQAMREASKTGGAVGNVSDREGDKLENTLAALGQAQSTADFKSQLGKARRQLQLSKAIIQRTYNEQYGGATPDAAPAAPQGLPDMSAIDAEIARRRKK